MDPKKRELLSGEFLSFSKSLGIGMVVKLKELLEQEEEEGVEIHLPEVTLVSNESTPSHFQNEPATKQRKILEDLKKGAIQKAKEMTESFLQEVEELKPPAEEHSAVALTASDMCHLTATYLDKA